MASAVVVIVAAVVAILDVAAGIDPVLPDSAVASQWLLPHDQDP